MQTIVPDYFSPAVEGYFRIPAIWVSDRVDGHAIAGPLPGMRADAPVYEATLRCGIRVRASHNGTFRFDFRNWQIAPVTLIPGYAEGPPPDLVPVATSRAQELAEERAVVRAQVMNAHQAFFTTAENLVAGRYAAMGFPLTAAASHKAINFSQPLHSHIDSEDPYALARHVIDGRFQLETPLQRRHIEVAVIARSFELLDELLLSQPELGVPVVEAAYMSASRAVESRFGESLTLGWSVCEQLTSVLWAMHIQRLNKDGEALQRVNRKRREKLTGRDYTASIVVEMLEVTGVIPIDLYRLLDAARGARNNWAHDLVKPGADVVEGCVRAIEQLLQIVWGITLRLSTARRGGVPTWPRNVWEAHVDRDD